MKYIVTECYEDCTKVDRVDYEDKRESCLTLFYISLSWKGERDKYNLYRFKPGITGLSQIINIDMSNPELLAESDYKMMININQIAYLKYLIRTVIGKGNGDAMLYK